MSLATRALPVLHSLPDQDIQIAVVVNFNVSPVWFCRVCGHHCAAAAAILPEPRVWWHSQRITCQALYATTNDDDTGDHNDVPDQQDVAPPPTADYRALSMSTF